MREWERGDRVVHRRRPLTGHGHVVQPSLNNPLLVRVQYDDGGGDWLHIDDLIPEDTTCGSEALL